MVGGERWTAQNQALCHNFDEREKFSIWSPKMKKLSRSLRQKGQLWILYFSPFFEVGVTALFRHYYRLDYDYYLCCRRLFFCCRCFFVYDRIGLMWSGYPLPSRNLRYETTSQAAYGRFLPTAFEMPDSFHGLSKKFTAVSCMEWRIKRGTQEKAFCSMNMQLGCLTADGVSMDTWCNDCQRNRKEFHFSLDLVLAYLYGGTRLAFRICQSRFLAFSGVNKRDFKQIRWIPDYLADSFISRLALPSHQSICSFMIQRGCLVKLTLVCIKIWLLQYHKILPKQRVNLKFAFLSVTLELVLSLHSRYSRICFPYFFLPAVYVWFEARNKSGPSGSHPPRS